MNKHRGGDALAFVQAVVDANPEAKVEYERLRPRYELIEKIIRARKAAGLTQAQLAERMQVSRPVVSRLESGAHEPRFDLIQRAADALGRQLVVEFKPATTTRTAVRASAQEPRPPATAQGSKTNGSRAGTPRAKRRLGA